MKTVAVQIGNSDDKLTQAEWACFVNDMHSAIQQRARPVHFSGSAASHAPWQNFAWVFEVEDADIPALRVELAAVRAMYKQDSVAWLEGATEFV